VHRYTLACCHSPHYCCFAHSAAAAASRYSTLHKLLVQQAPRGSVAGLMWLLESAGFSAVQLATQLETYYVGSNAFPGFRSVISFEL
jgi:hypothetical protein